MDRVLRPAAGVEIPATSVNWRFDPSGGPGGQHANRSNTRVEATLNLTDLDIPHEFATRLQNAYGFELKVVVDQTRSQTRNRDLALDRLEERLRSALVTKPKRRKTKPSRSAKRRRVDSKRRRGDLKKTRRSPATDD
jgi:ribosome-associated protein